jgi:hypothetical protein
MRFFSFCASSTAVQIAIIYILGDLGVLAVKFSRASTTVVNDHALADDVP